MEKAQATQKEVVQVELEVEELEAKIAPKIAINHNQTLVRK